MGLLLLVSMNTVLLTYLTMLIIKNYLYHKRTKDVSDRIDKNGW
jgi:hypothetical protein